MPDYRYLTRTGDNTDMSLIGFVFFWDVHKKGDSRGDLSMQQSWDLGGLYVLTGVSPYNIAQFFTKLSAYLNNDRDRTKIVWIKNPNEDVSDWQGTTMLVDPETQLLTEVAEFELQNYQVNILPGAQFEYEEGTFGVTLKIVDMWATELFKQTRPDSKLFGHAGNAKITFVDSGGSKILFTPFKVNPDDNFFQDFDVGVRLYYPDPDNPTKYQSVRFRVFNDNSIRKCFYLHTTITPYALNDSASTNFYFLVGDEYPKIELESFYTTNLGIPIYLIPLPNKSGFCFLDNPANGEDRLTMVPLGSYGVRIVPSEAEPKILCGVAGTEFLDINDTSGAVDFRFHANGAALVPGFDPNDLDVDPQKEPLALSDVIKTPWLSMTSDKEIHYYAQPETAALYELTANNPLVANGLTYFDYKEIPASKLNPNSEVIFPMVPFSGLSDQAKIALGLEVQGISSARRERLEPSMYRTDIDMSVLADNQLVHDAPIPTLETGQAITPQGWRATFETVEGEEKWKYLNLGRSLRAVTPGNGDDFEEVTEQLRFQDIKPPLKSALLTSEQFMVITDPDAFAPFFKDYTSISIADWGFDIAPEAWRAHGTILIVKNAKESIAELVANPGSWAEGAYFNAKPSVVSQSIQKIIQEATERESELHRQVSNPTRIYTSADIENSDYRYFLKVVNSPEWNGFLVLNAFVSLDHLPPSLRGLAAGIDKKYFYAHHFGITQSPFRDEDEDKEPYSALFGLISYQSRRKPYAQLGQNYAFDVRTLKILFQNSAILDFSSHLSLDVQRLFGSTSFNETENTSIMEFTGIYQRKADGDSYDFSLDRSSTYNLDNEVLTSVDIWQGSFFTYVDQSNALGAENNLVRAGFRFTGEMNFANLVRDDEPDWFDLFSYKNLAFSNLRVDFSFAQDTPEIVTYKFSTGSMALQLESSSLRDDSFAAHFPIRASAVIGDSAGGPKAAGFTAVGLPFSTSAVNGAWQGLSMDLQLGLINDIGDAIGVTAQLLLAWAPSAGRPKFMLGLKLPGGSGTNEISIYGVIKAVIYSLDLRHDGNEYALMLNGVNLKIFGKTLPPGGSFDFYLFGDPGAEATPDQLGWYGAYKKDAEESSGNSTNTPRLS